MNLSRRAKIIRAVFKLLGAGSAIASSVAAEHVMLVSVDGLRPAAIEQLLAAGELPHFARLQREGIWTHNARSDFNHTVTVPNHVSMVTGRPVDGALGHNYTSNGSPGASTTLHSVKGSYLASMFDVAHDRGLTTSVHRSKSKLVIIDQSYSATTGAEDLEGEDNGRSKIDIARYLVESSQASRLVDLVERDLESAPVNLSFVHLLDPDSAGHGSNWDTSGYFDAVRRVDSYLGRLLKLVDENEPYAGRTTIILVADHGGAGGFHSVEDDPENYVIPFYIWGADVPIAGNLYALNADRRTDPGVGRPDYSGSASEQPIRNGDGGNLALQLLGLPAIPGSTIGVDQDLRVAASLMGDPKLAVRILPSGIAQLRWSAATPSTVQISDDLTSWRKAAGDWPSTQSYWVDDGATGASRYFRLLTE